jgi:hypothetical protein
MAKGATRGPWVDGRFASYAAYTILALVWLPILQVFAGNMAPRLNGFFSARPIANTPPCDSPQCDFSAFWPAGRLARAHDYVTLYHPDLFLAFRQHVLFAGANRLSWFYPPPSLLPAMGISFLPFETGFIVWVALLILLAVLALRAAGLSWPVVLLGLLSPAALWDIQLGQLGLITGALLVAGLLLAPRTPRPAGALLGLLIIKPQAALLLPVVFLAARAWRVIAAAMLTLLVTLLAVWALLGGQVWVQYFTAGRETTQAVLKAALYPHGYATFGVSVFWMARSLGGGLAISYALQAVAALAASVLAWRIWRRPVPVLDRMALTVFLSLLATPYGYTDDMVGWSVALAALAERRGWRISLLDALFWLWPALCPIVTNKTGILFTPIIVALAVLRTWHRAGLGLPHLPGRAAVLPRAGA